MKSNWWYEASPEDRMSQVKNGAQLGMTIEQVATNLKVKSVVVKFFAKDHDIKFNKEERKRTEILLMQEAAFEVASEATFMAADKLLDIDDSSDYMVDILSSFGDIIASSIEEWN